MSTKVIYLIKVLLVGVLPCCLMTISVNGNQADPEQAFQNYWAAMQKQDWVAATRLVHPQYLKRIRTAAGNYTDALLVLDKSGMNLQSDFGIKTKEEFDKLTDAVVFQKILEYLARGPGFVELLKATTFQIIGSVKEDDDLAHIICRRDVKFLDAQGNRLNSVTFNPSNKGALFSMWSTITIPDRDKDLAEVITTKRDKAAWLVVPGPEIEDMVNHWTKNLKQITNSPKKSAKPR